MSRAALNMAPEHILRLPRSDSEGDYVLVNIMSNGASPLDLRLLATEGESPYITEIKQKRISKLRDHRNKLSDSEWETTLLLALTQRRTPKTEAAHLKKLEIIAAIAGESLAITLRHNTSGITQKLGDIVLKADAKQELDIVSWAGTAVQRSTELESEVHDLTVKYDEQSKTMEKLNRQLEDLIQAKKEHEDALLQKFRELLNTKKLKIRDQQRLLAGAKVDPNQAAKLQNARAMSKAHMPTASRAGKRKANGAAVVDKESSEEESFERKTLMQNKEESDGSEQVNTPDATDQDVTEDERDDDLDFASRGQGLPDRRKEMEEGGKVGDMQLDTPPPPRELPFGKADVGGGREQVAEDKSTLNQEAENEDEETDDDEL